MELTEDERQSFVAEATAWLHANAEARPARAERMVATAAAAGRPVARRQYSAHPRNCCCVVTLAVAIAIAAAALRTIEIQRLIGPALLTLVFYLWDAFAGTSPSRRRDGGWIWQMLLLAILGIGVIAWNLLLRH